MKTKLLRKIRKRFEINYYPTGIENIRPEPCVALIEKDGYYKDGFKIREIGYINQFNSKEHVFKGCLVTLMWLITRKYANYGVRRKNKLKTEKLWHSGGKL